jgi:hypothetical protein
VQLNQDKGKVKSKRKKKIHKDKNGREFIKETYFIGGKMKFQKIYVIDGIPADEFYERNATDLYFYLNGDYELMNSEQDSNNHFNEQNNKEPDSHYNEGTEDLPF